MKGGQDGGTVVGQVKIWSLAYADDIALIAESESGLKQMIKRFIRYLNKRELELNIEKSTIVVFNKGERKTGQEWSCEKGKIEEVKEFTWI